jgi:hypothetical protein
MSDDRNELNNSGTEDEFYYCDCECEGVNRNGENYDFLCDCECTTIGQTMTIRGVKIEKIRFSVPGLKITLPIKAGSKKIPLHRRIKIRIPRATVSNCLPKGTLQRNLCEPERLNLNTVDSGTINVCSVVLPGAQVGSNPFESTSQIPIRLRLDLEAANQIWQQSVNGKMQGVKFNLVRTVISKEQLQGIGENVQDFPWNQKNIEKVIFEHGKRVCPNAQVFVYYMNGNHIGPIYPNGTRCDAITFRSFPVIILSNHSLLNRYILAHELGHLMYLNNLFGYTFDPDPSPFDPDHNANPDNLMYYKSDYWPKPRPTITPAQIRKALNTRFFYE